MNYSSVNEQLTTAIPDTFARSGYVFKGIISSIVAALTRGTTAFDQVAPNLYLTNNIPVLPLVKLPDGTYLTQPNPYVPLARWGWLDAIGELYGVPRYNNEIDPNYRARLAYTLISPHVTPNAIVKFIANSFPNIFGPPPASYSKITVNENFADATYSLDFDIPVSTANLQAIANAINWVRPAGVPFLPFGQVIGGLFLNTINYFGVKRVTGSYLDRPTIGSNITIGAGTNNPTPLLPTTLLTDPYVTGTATT